MDLTKSRFIVMAVPLAAFGFTLLLGGGRQAAAEKPFPTLTILYDNTAAKEGLKPDWGFAAIIQGLEKTILFDTGTKEDVFLNNVTALEVDLGKVELVFVSHEHSDHTGGLQAFLRIKSGIPVYVPAGAGQPFQAALNKAGGQVVAVKDPVTLMPGIFSIGDVGKAIPEQAMVFDTPKGLILVTGCAHPGIVMMVEKAKELGKKDVWMVLGGFHLVQTPPAEVEKIVARFKELGVKRVGATHCTGAPAIEMFRKAYGPDFVELGVGRKIELGGR